MGDKKNFAALDWVIGEIAETLNDARTALEAFVEDSKDSTKMRFCLTHIHQVYGSLQMVEFHGASLLAEEMEHLAQSIINNAVSSAPEAHEVLMRSMLQLPIYLERVKNQKEDNPAVILPLLNDLRAVRKQSYLSETNLFSPDLSSLGRVEGSKHSIAHDPKKLKEVLKKLREMYQFSAASVLRDIKTRENLEYIEKVFNRLELITAGTGCCKLWEAASAMLEGLRDDNIQLSVAVRGLLRYLARELRILGESAPGSLDMQPRESLLKNLLYYVARSKNDSKKISAVKKKYKLDKALLGAGENLNKGSVGEADPDAIRSVVVALQDEINSIKHILDLSLSGQNSSHELKEVLPVVKRVADTLAVLGIGDLRKQVLEQAEVIESLSNQNEVDGYQLMEVANKVVEIENRLAVIAKVAGKQKDLDSLDEREVEIDQAKRTVLKECQRGLEQAKDAIVEYISSQWDKSHLQHVNGLLTDIRGGLDMVPLARPGKILQACNQYIQEKLLADDSRPDWNSLDALADAIASVEYFIERLIEDFDEDLDPLLDIAEESINTLGYSVEQTNKVAAKESARKATKQPSKQEQKGSAIEKGPRRIEEQEPSVSDKAVAAKPAENVSIEEPSPQSELKPTVENREPQIKEVEKTVSSGVSETVPAAEKPEPIISLDKISVEDADDEDIDEEIIEIFIEEAGEVSETLAEYFPKWRVNREDSDSLVVVRRAFHTLKGSGRMVEALDIGELAWSVENMLNRVIDKTVRAQDAHGNLITLVLNLLPDLIEAFKNRSSNPSQELCEQYMAWGTELSEGNVPDALLQEVVADRPAVEPEAEIEEENEDHVLWDIFSSEAESHLDVMEEFITEMTEAAPLYTPPSDAVQRAMHTLKGSAKMAQVNAIAELVEPLEAFAKELISYQVKINADILQLLTDAVLYIREGLTYIELRREVHIPKIKQFLARSEELRELAVGHLIRLSELEKLGGNQVDPNLLSIFMAEEMKMLLDADQLLKQWQQENSEVVDLNGLIKELSLLEVGAEKANLPEMVALVNDLRLVHESALEQRILVDDNFFGAVGRGHECLLDLVDAVAAGQNLVAPPEDIQPALKALLENTFEEVVIEDLVDAQPQAEQASESFVVEESSESVDEYQFDQAADAEEYVFDEEETEEAGEEILFEEDSGLIDEAEHEEIIDEALPEATFEYEKDAEGDQLTVAEPVEEIVVEAPQEIVEPEPELENIVEVEISAEELAAPKTEPAAQNDPAETPQQEEDYISAAAPGEIPGLLDAIDVNDEDFDEGILEVFVEEAEELIEELDEAVHAWETDWSDVDSVESITRALHTLKGGARLAGMTNLGQLTHEYESYLLGVDIADVDGVFFDNIHNYQDRVLSGVRGIQKFMDADIIVSAQPDTPVTESKVVANSRHAVEPAKVDDDDNVLPFANKVKEGQPQTLPIAPRGGDESEFVMPSVTPGGAQAATQVAARKAGPQEVVKVSAELLEELVNLAGETSISRGRLEQQVNDFGSAIDEIDGTIDRLQEQLRRLDIETQAQILFRQEQIEEHQRDFDPLEMDRYSALQQLSRSLIESASDLMDLKATLADKVRDTETLLLQQSRINSTLQEGLMRSRMVPFSRLVPRLRRIVRQVASELGKQVSFELDNVEGELDRSVLERMVAPLEHMLRNAVDHGIESPSDRLESNKPEAGRIVLTLGREGGDVILRLADDGRGIDLKRVREKAIERGLMTKEAQLSDHDVMQFILHAGFSTAENVTQISGRGVGMDVVYAEIKQLGGTVSINSAWGKGTEFFVRLPFTVSVNRALMVDLAGDHYAVPLNTIEGIVRVSPFELEHYYADPEARFEYAGERYEVRYLGTMLDRNARPRLEGKSLPIPVLLVRSAEHTMALQVDGLMGSREIVVKTLGQQFSLVQGLSGATVMGDGSVVVILDPHALVRKEVALSSARTTLLEATPAELPALPQEEARITTVMVVDDSVTVRKVTTRFLEREGFEVITAKDGVDALEVLQDRIPDLMLLDIEMPRMDGFEVAKNVRTTSRWKHLPIIMITSRTGDKHRDHALSLGVNKYLGKPYQEDVLLESIKELLADSPDEKD